MNNELNVALVWQMRHTKAAARKHVVNFPLFVLVVEFTKNTFVEKIKYPKEMKRKKTNKKITPFPVMIPDFNQEWFYTSSNYFLHVSY